MAELRTIARPYAKAAFQVAVEKQALDSWSLQLSSLAAVSADDAIAKLIATPSIAADRKASTLVSLLGDDADSAVKNFVAVLAENHRLDLLRTVHELFEELKADRERSVDVNIVSAFPLEGDAASKLGDALKVKLSREVNVETSVDKTLLGGVLIKAGDVVIDGSVRGRLAKLAETMNL